MEQTGWHRRLRAWNAGEPPFPLEPVLEERELELTSALISLQQQPPPFPLLGPDGCLASAIERLCPAIVGLDEALWETTTDVLARAELVPYDVLCADVAQHAVAAEPDPSRRKDGLWAVAEPIALAITAIDLLSPRTGFNGLITSGYCIAVLGRMDHSATAVIRERLVSLTALERNVERSCADMQNGADGGTDRLIRHLYADMLKAHRRLGRTE